MVGIAPNHEFCYPKGKDSAGIGNNEVENLVEKSIEIEDDEEVEEPEIIIDTVVHSFELDDDSSSETSLRAVKLTRSAANESMRQELNNISKPTEFVIVSTISEATVKFPDDVQIKDELAEPIATACSANDEDALENDPMGLLEINDRSDEANSTKSNVEQDDIADDISSTCSSSVQTTTSTVNISDWAKDYPWLLHEECDEWYGYCLYCDVKLSVRSQKSAKHHGMSLYHRERCEHYLAFREEEEKNNLGTSVAEIKQEFGTDSYVTALKLKRKTQAEAFNNYNWRRWLEECPWLERESSAGTIGLCKYCSVRLNVEFSYLRHRHQESGQHKERVKRHSKLNDVNEVNEANEEDEEDDEDATTNGKADNQADGDGDEDEQQTTKSDGTWSLELIDERTGRCTLCDTVLKKRSSFKRHLLTQSHIHNEKTHLLVTQQNAKNGKSSLQDDNETTLSKTPPNCWSMYAQMHPWLTVDPLDTTFAYCIYCKKRILYGSSAPKRATHENSYSHKANEKEYKQSQEKDENQDPAQGNEEDESAIDGGDEDGDDDEEAEEAETGETSNVQDEEAKEKSESESESGQEEASDEEDHQEDDADEEDENSDEEDKEEDKEEEEEEEEEANADEEDSNKSKKRPIRTTAAEWYNQFAWCKKYKKDSKYCYCSYCKIPITKGNRKKHGYSKRHIEAEEKVLSRKNRTEVKKGAKEEDLFEWAVDIKAQPNLYYCKFCRVRISKHYSKKQHSVSKIHQINEKLYQNRKNPVNPETDAKNTQSETPAQSSQQRNETPALRKLVVKGPSFITSIKQWQKRHSWLGYKRSELRSNYAYCKACEQSLYVRSFKNVIKHQRSSKHMRIVNQLKRDRQKEANSIEVDKKSTKREVDQNASAKTADTPIQRENSGEVNNSMKDSARGSNYKSTIDTMQKRYSWITKSTKPDHAYCRYCDDDVPLKIIFLRNHTNSRSHRRSVVNLGGAKTKTEQNQQDGSNAADKEGEDDNDDEAADVEAGDDEADDDVVLLEDNTEEILISEQDDNWTVKSENMDEHEALDCLLQRAGNSGQANNSANVSRDDRKQATTTDERPSKRFKRSHSFRRLNDSTNSSIISSILSTPLTLASCLGPLIQQQIQQVTNLQQASASQAAATSGASEPPPSRTKEPENSYDLFFKSVSETMKKLPVDIAAEGKVKVMQIICDLELKALKRQEQHCSLAGEQSVEQSNNANVSSSPLMNAPNFQVLANSPTIGNKTNSNVVAATTLNFANCNSNEQRSETNGNNPNSTAPDQYMGETVITPIYGNVNTSPTNRQPHQQHYSQQIQQKTQHTSVSTLSNPTYNAPSSSATNVAMDKNKNINQAPIIGVMDMNGLQTLQLRNSPIVKQIPKQNLTPNSGQPTGTTTSIRCIPFKNLTQSTSGDTNTKITRIQVPMATSTPTSQSSQNNASGMTNATKGLLNLRSIHITKRTNATPQQQSPQTSSPVSVSVVNPITDKNQQATYVQASNMQRWTAVNGSINTIANKKPQQQSTTTTTATFQVSAKHQNYTNINRNYK